MITSISQELIDETIVELKRIYKNITMNEGKSQRYLGMLFDFESDHVKVSMNDIIDGIILDYKVEGIATTPAAHNLFTVDENSPKLDTKQKEIFHTITAKLLYLAKRGRPDILTAVAYLTTRVQIPTEKDFLKLERCLKYLNGSRDIAMRLSGIDDVHASIDASHGVHHDCKGHTGTEITIGKGIVFGRSAKQKLVAKSSAESELIGLSDSLPQVIWTRNWLISQGYKPKPATVYQDNMSTMALIKKGKSTSMNTRHVNIRYFFAKDRVDSKEIEIKYLNTENMISDIFTKPLQGKRFVELRNKMMNII
jgi:hypothetical protein